MCRVFEVKNITVTHALNNIAHTLGINHSFFRCHAKLPRCYPEKLLSMTV